MRDVISGAFDLCSVSGKSADGDVSIVGARNNLLLFLRVSICKFSKINIIRILLRTSDILAGTHQCSYARRTRNPRGIPIVDGSAIRLDVIEAE